MNMTKWAPFGGLDDIFGRPFGGFLERANVNNGMSLFDGEYEWRPAANISETGNEFVIKAELPGVKKEDVEISFDRGVLSIQGERKIEKTEKDEKAHRTESFYGKYSRSFSLPENIDEKKVKATCKDGVLTVRLPKMEKEVRTPKKISVD